MLITVIEPGFELLTPLGPETLMLLELAGRTCYKSEDRITEGSAERFVRAIRKSGHESVLEHTVATVRIIGSRSMSHQLVRHRIAAYSQESQRYCNYGKKGFQVICPPTIGLHPGAYYFRKKYPTVFYTDPEFVNLWLDHTEFNFRWLCGRTAECIEYLDYINNGIPPEDARECLPNAMKTEVVATYNLRQWRHVFCERALNKHAQWQIRGIMLSILNEFARRLPAVFEDLLEKENR